MGYTKIPIVSVGNEQAYDSFADFPATGERGLIYIDKDNADLYLWDGSVYELQSSAGGGGDVVGPSSATDNAVVRFDSTTGKLVQDSRAKILDVGTIETSPSGTGNVDAISIQNTTAQVPIVRWQPASGDVGLAFYSGTNLVMRIQDNGFAYFTKFGTTGGLNIDNFYFQRGAGPKFELGDADFGASVSVGYDQAFSEAMFKVLSNRASNIVMFIKGASSQSGDLLQFHASDGTVLSKFDSVGQLSFSTANTTHWATAVPTTTKEAIERLASAVSNSGASPIP